MQPKKTIDQLEEEDAGKGVSIEICDRAFWREIYEPDDDWVAALDKTDRGNKQPLIEKLRSNRELMPTARHYLADLIERGVAETKPPLRALAHGLPDEDVWVAAVDAVDRDEKEPLTALLRSDLELSPLARGYLADLIARGVKKPANRPRISAYDMSDAEAAVRIACDVVRYHVHEAPKPKRLTVGQALAKVAAKRRIDPTTLADSYRGARGATRRHKRRQRNP
jgi:hypothetical protein